MYNVVTESSLQKTLNNLFSTVRNQNFNFSVKETPFSVQISIKKTKIKFYENTDSENPLMFEKIGGPDEYLKKINSLELENGSLIVKCENQKRLTADVKGELESISLEKEAIEEEKTMT